MNKFVKYVVNSKNVKISGTKQVDATYVSIGSCPETCPFISGECYAMLGNVGVHVNKLEKNKSSIFYAKEEAKAIDESYYSGKVPGAFLRIHISGDCRTKTAAKIVNAAVGRWKKRGGNKAWSYTHAWAHVPRKTWSNVSILASVESASQAKEAFQKGYVPAIVVAEFESDKAFYREGIKFIPCPAQTKSNVNCSSCKLCFDDSKLMERKTGIAFAAHGVRKNKVKLKVIQ